MRHSCASQSRHELVLGTQKTPTRSSESEFRGKGKVSFRPRGLLLFVAPIGTFFEFLAGFVAFASGRFQVEDQVFHVQT